MQKKFIFISLLSIFCFILNNCSTIKNSIQLVELQQLDSTIIIDVRYATKNNFTGEILYPTSKIYLIDKVAFQIVKVNQYLKDHYGLRLKIFDGYRPLSVQKKMWSIIPDERYVANPKKGSRHNRGCAVDLTLIDSTGNELDMGTKYDDFTEKSHIDFYDLPDHVIKNRRLLLETMTKFGFTPLQTEWWHFDYKDWERYPILDIEIK